MQGLNPLITLHVSTMRMRFPNILSVFYFHTHCLIPHANGVCLMSEGQAKAVAASMALNHGTVTAFFGDLMSHSYADLHTKETLNEILYHRDAS